jgi:hypothetical protein
MADRYEQLVQCGRESAHKSRAAGAHFSLGDYISRLNINEEENELSGTREKSAVGNSAEAGQKRSDPGVQRVVLHLLRDSRSQRDSLDV